MKKKYSLNKFRKWRYIVLVVAIIGLLGTSYGYWMDTLEIKADITTGRLMVEGTKSPDPVYYEVGETPSHPINGCPDGGDCEFQNWWDHEEVGGVSEKFPISVTDVEIKESNSGGRKVHSGTATIKISIKNTGKVPAQVSIYDAGDSVYKQTWLKIMAPFKDEEDRVVLAQGFYKNQELVLKGDTKLDVGEISELTIENFEFFTADCDANKLDLQQIRIEAQVCLEFDLLENKSWTGNTCNSLFINRPIEESEIEREEQAAKPKCNITCNHYNNPTNGCSKKCDRTIEQDGVWVGNCSDCKIDCPCSNADNKEVGGIGNGILPTPLPLPLPEEVPTPLPLPRPEEVPTPLPEVSNPVEEPTNPEIPIVESTIESNDTEEQVVSPQGGENQ